MKSKKLFAFIFLFFAVVLAFFAGNNLRKSDTAGPRVEEKKQQNIGWNLYKNHGFSIEYPPEYLVSEGEDKTAISFRFSDGGSGAMGGYLLANQFGNLDGFLTEMDKINQTAYEGQPAKEVLESEKIKIGSYEAVLRKELWLAAGFTTESVYIEAENNIYVFSLFPADEVYTESERDVFHKFINSFELIK